jgi:hypothetical protein
MTAESPRKGESSRKIVRYDLRIQPAFSVRGSSRRIMSMRFRPAYISVINRRANSPAVIGAAVGKDNSRLTSGNVFPLRRPSGSVRNARTVLTVKGSLRRARQRRALDRSAPFRPEPFRDGRLRREHSPIPQPKNKASPHHIEVSLTQSLHISFPSAAPRVPLRMFALARAATQGVAPAVPGAR